ncbi:type I restriction endonuclease subunit R [Rothia sp. SD9660Na]|uniref:type I restriction endonuclease subunit R n=1 Tax=Rothia sp. SD9660Na TaxID=3047030 RepID=UPI0024BB83F1|nr:type I restriction endonuclease subunit R [Rothia sp. SD9660Na]WHS50330.1 type I restriction endonuclease subunit R [Rothia sp. SD9660Na]
MAFIDESEWESFALDILGELSWQPLHGTQIAPNARGEDDINGKLPYEHLREKNDTLEIPGMLREAIARLNPELTPEDIRTVAESVLTAASIDPKAENREAHKYITKGYKGLTIKRHDGSEYNPTVRIISRNPDENRWLAVQQVTLKTLDKERRFDIVLYCNGLPVGIIELKRAGDPNADLRGAHNQINQYLHDFPLAFRYNVLTIISDGITARYGTPFTPYPHMSVWNVDDDGKLIDFTTETPDPSDYESQTALEALLFGVANQERFLDLLNNYIVFTSVPNEQGGVQTTKIIAKPHQYFAVSRAVTETMRAVTGNRQIGVVWHTQGSGKSLEMVFYDNIVMRHQHLNNPTTIVVTDRTDLDDQLFNTFSSTLDFLPETPYEIESIAELRSELQGRQQGGIYFTTLQKFAKTKDEKDAGLSHQMLSDRSNIIIMVDEAHRSHYDNLDGFARNIRDALPKASFIAFTGTPIEKLETNTQAVFGDYIDIYDLTRAVKDGATVPVKYESRYIPLELPDGETIENINDVAERLTEELDEAERRKTEQAVLRMNTMYGSPNRLKKLAADLVEHWETRSSSMKQLIGVPGKGMIVGVTRQVCADLYDHIIELRPDWAGTGINDGKIQVLYTGSASDEEDIARFARNGQASKTLQARLKNPNDPLELIIVQSMLLTGFDAPALHTMYLDRPLKGALLMQALARVNRTYKEKQEALLVGYAPIIDNLREALGIYASSHTAGAPGEHDMQTAAENALNLITEIEYLLQPVHGWKEKILGEGNHRPNPADRIAALRMVMGFLLSNRQATEPVIKDSDSIDGTPRRPQKTEKSIYSKFVERSSQLTRLYNFVASTHENDKVKELKQKTVYVQFFEEVRVAAAKNLAEDRVSRGLPVPEDIKRLLENYTEGLIETGEVKDLHKLAGIPAPDLNELNLDFARQAAENSSEPLALEALRKAMQRQMRDTVGHNQTRQAYYGEKLQDLVTKYNNSQLSFVEIMEHIIELGKELKQEAMRGEELGLTYDEMIFYDTLEACDRAELEYSADALADIARGIANAIQGSHRDWLSQPTQRAKLRKTVKRLLRKHKYPPKGQDEARRRVLEQMEIIAEERSKRQNGE